MPYVQRSADGRRGRVDREHLLARCGAIEADSTPSRSQASLHFASSPSRRRSGTLGYVRWLALACPAAFEAKLGIVAEPFLALGAMRRAVHAPDLPVGQAEARAILLAPLEVEEALRARRPTPAPVASCGPRREGTRA